MYFGHGRNRTVSFNLFLNYKNEKTDNKTENELKHFQNRSCLNLSPCHSIPTDKQIDRQIGFAVYFSDYLLFQHIEELILKDTLFPGS
jgi:hypothetical protein